MLPINAYPTRKFITADPSKLTYFARANAVRAGTVSTWGALSGLGAAMPTGMEQASSETVKTAGALQTVGDLFGSIGRSLLGASTPPPAPVVPPEEPSVMPYVVGVGAAVLVGVVVWKVAKR